MQEEKEVIREYSNGEITVVWKPKKCTHASFCWKELIEVFDPKKRPWVNIHGADSERIRKQVNRCPSGALTYYENNAESKVETPEKSPISVEVNQGGPLMVNGNVEIKLGDGTIKKIEGAAFCRCGQSKNQPFCDGSHIKIGFNK